jgi:hypothetical protein
MVIYILSTLLLAPIKYDSVAACTCRTQYKKSSSTVAAYMLAAAAIVEIKCIAVYEHVLLLAIYINILRSTVSQ